MIVTEGGSTVGNSECNTSDEVIGKADVVGDFKVYLAGIMPIDEDATGDDTGYYIKRVANSFFVKNCNAYEDEYVFPCGSDLIDSRDSKTYATVLIGTQCWMAENINVGTMVTGVSGQWDNATLEKFCYDDSEANCTSDGGLYQLNEAGDYFSGNGCNGTGESQPACTNPIQGICPSGWHVPSHYEFTLLEREVCTSGTCATDFPYDETTFGLRGTDEGTKLKMGGSSGFDAILVGLWNPSSNIFERRLTYGHFWTSTDTIGPEALERYLSSASGVNRLGTGNGMGYWEDTGFSVRCIQN